MTLEPTLPPEDHADGCYPQDCGIHFGCDCGKVITVCRGSRALYPHGHGEDFGECAYRQSHPDEERSAA